MSNLMTRLAGVAVLSWLAIAGPAVAAESESLERVHSERLVTTIRDFSKEFQRTFTVSADNRRFAYAAVVGSRFARKLSVVVDGDEVGQYDDLVGAPVFSPDGQHVAFAARQGDARIVVMDGKEIASHERFGGDIEFSPDSARIAYAVRTTDRKWTVIVDGQPGRLHDGIGTGNIRFSPDSRRFAYAARDSDNWYVIVDGKEGQHYDGIVDSSLVFSPDGQLVAYIAKLADKRFVDVGEQHLGPFDVVGKIAFSRDSKRFGFAAVQSGVRIVVVDGKEYGHHEDVGADSLVFSPDGTRVAYGARAKDKSFVVVDGKEGPGYANLAESILFSPDGRRIAYQAVKEGNGKQWYLVVDGKESGPFDGMHYMTFSPDGRYLACKVRRGSSWSVALSAEDANLQEGVTYHGIGKVVFESANELHYSAWRRSGGIHELYFVNERIVQKADR